MPPGAGRQAGKLHCANANAGQPRDRVAERLHHTAHLPVAALINSQFQSGPSGSVSILFAPEQTHILRRLGQAVVQHDPLAKPLQGIGIGDALHFHAVRLRDMVARVGHLEQKIAVVGHKNQAVAVRVQPSHGPQHGLPADVHQVCHQPPGVRVGARRDYASGLVQSQIIAPRGLPDDLPIKLHLVPV